MSEKQGLLGQPVSSSRHVRHASAHHGTERERERERKDEEGWGRGENSGQSENNDGNRSRKKVEIYSITNVLDGNGKKNA